MKIFILTAVVLSLALLPAQARAINVYCPGDTDGDGISDTPGILCEHYAASDGFSQMADGLPIYTFGFSDVTGTPDGVVMSASALKANLPAPTLRLGEGEDMYLTLSNVGMMMRPDLFDPHTVHFHGFPNAGSIYDGVPDSSIAIDMDASFTYYYKGIEPGTYMYHCHVEVTEHMEMGMTGQAVIDPAQNGESINFGGRTYTQFAYNDGDGSTGYDVEKLLQLVDFDRAFHDANEGVQPLPFSDLDGTYPLLNGRGYPDTVSATPILNVNGDNVQPQDSKVTVTAGQRVLVRLTNLSATDYHTVTLLGIPMQVIGTGARILRGPGGASLYYNTDSVTLGGGESADIILDTAGINPGTYYLYSRNLYDLNNYQERRGGIMTEFVVQ